MMWRRVLLAAIGAVALLSHETRADNGCPDGQFSVSVLDDPQVKCLASRPCSGVYGPDGLVTGVGACPSGTGCALLPNNPAIMGCVIEGRADVSYVNPDGSLSRGGKVISGAPVKNSESGSQPTSAPTTSPSNTNTNTNNANNANNANNGTMPATTKPTTTSEPTTPAHVKPGDAASIETKTPSPVPTTAATPSTEDNASPSSSSSGGAATTPASSASSQTNSQSALDNIDGGIANNNRGSSGANGIGLSSIIAIVVGCLAVVAVIAGVFVLRKKKEQSLDTPAGGALEDYGAGGVTPKENVLLL